MHTKFFLILFITRPSSHAITLLTLNPHVDEKSVDLDHLVKPADLDLHCIQKKILCFKKRMLTVCLLGHLQYLGSSVTIASKDPLNYTLCTLQFCLIPHLLLKQ